MNKKGFTLIELLVVIAIIGLLTTMSVLALQSSRARARDAKRLSDVKQLQTALGLYEHDAQSYPATASITPGASISYNGVVYMALVPAPPIPDDGCSGSAAYTYAMQTVSGDQTSYTLKYCLGATTAEIPSGLNVATPAGITSE
ncbi:MAG: prepilin-type N-terminal cleavage/methylation domain-containing protein [Patescibacteria group bacterium]